MFVCIHEIKVLLAQAQQSEWFAYIQDLKGFHEKWKKSALLHKIALWITGISLFWNWINSTWCVLLCAPTEQQSFIVFAENNRGGFFFFPNSAGDLKKSGEKK